MSNFEIFQSSFKGDIVTPSSPDYEEAIARWAKNAIRKANIIAYVKDGQDVALAIEYATTEKMALAIRGGGHNVTGASSTDGGLVIDLSRYLNGARIDPGTKLAYVGGGAIWETVDKNAIQHGLATVGGTVNHTGVGGLTLGGGYGWLSGAHGLTIDNLVQATLVLADGSIVNTSESENEDLFWGIRGGGCNFGVCIEFTFKLHEQRRTVYSGCLTFSEEQLEVVQAATYDWWRNGPSEKEGIYQFLSTSPPPACKPLILCYVFYNGSEAEGRENFRKFLDLSPIDGTKEIPFETLNSQFNPHVEHGLCRYLSAVKMSTLAPNYASSALRELLKHSPSDGQFHYMMNFELVNHLKKIGSVSNSAMAFSSRSETFNTMSLCTWEENIRENTDEAREAIHSLNNIFKTTKGNMIYGNYTSEQSVPLLDSSRALYGSNYPRLQQLKMKYDPHNVFNKWFPISPA